MENSDKSNESMLPDVRVQIAFPKSDEDHRLQLVGVNGSIFALVYSPLESNGPIRLDCEEWSLIILAPIKSKGDVVISATNVICLNTIESEEGSVSINASNQLANFSSSIKSALGVSEVGERGEYRLEDDTGTFLNCVQLFNNVVVDVRKDSPESILEAQQRFLSGISAIAEKIEGKKIPITIHRVLGIWDIPMLSS